MKKFFALVITAAMLISPCVVSAENIASEIVDNSPNLTVSNAQTYEAFLNSHKDDKMPTKKYVIDISNYTSTNNFSNSSDTELKENYYDKQGISLYTGEEDKVDFKVNIDEEGLYSIKLDFLAEYSRGSSIERKILINGEYQHEAAEDITFNRLYIDDPDGIGKTDVSGNDIRPSQVETKTWQNSRFVRDTTFEIAPMLFYFNKGENTITFESVSEPMTIANLSLENEKSRVNYKEKQDEYKSNGYEDANADSIILQAEQATYKSDTVLYPIVDRTTPSTTPYKKGMDKLNSIGGYRWQNPGQFLIWNFDVEKDGLYTIYVKARQNTARGVISNRTIYLDDEIPFSEFEDYDFSFNTKWQQIELGDSKTPYKVYLTKGSHQIKMESVLGESSEQIQKVQDVLLELNKIYTTIMTITGSKPDTMRDYYLDKLIPDSITRMGEIADELGAVVDWYESYSGTSGQSVSTLNTIIRQLNKFVDKPSLIAKNLDYFKSNISSVGSWLITAQQQPLELDYIAFVSNNDGSTELPAANSKLYKQIAFGFSQFIGSFISDYASIGAAATGNDEYESIKVWTSTGRDQAQSLRKIIDSSFVSQNKINVTLELVTPSALLPATVAGIGPDVALNMAETEPINYAIRNAVIDLTQFSDYEEVSKRFLDERMVPLTFDGKVYALPETQSFNVLFYRKDILSELGISIPQTWEDVISVITVLQKNNMSFAVPVSTTAAPQTGVSTYYTMLYQRGGQLYNDHGVSSALDSELGLSSFKQWTNLYVNYDLPKEYNFLDRFRTGEYPLIIGDFGNFNSLTVSAPEIRGLWGFTLIPGTVQQDGSIDRSMPIGGLNSFILKNSNNYDAAWKFLKWWTDADTQIAYGTEMESILGASARYATANLEAFERIPWTNELYKVLKEQMSWGRGIEQVPGSYFTARHLDNAFRKVTISSQDVKDTLFDYVYTINQELTSKREEFGLETIN